MIAKLSDNQTDTLTKGDSEGSPLVRFDRIQRHFVEFRLTKWESDTSDKAKCGGRVRSISARINARLYRLCAVMTMAKFKRVRFSNTAYISMTTISVLPNAASIRFIALY